jgi:hypothetical protein
MLHDKKDHGPMQFVLFSTSSCKDSPILPRSKAPVMVHDDF